MSRAMSPTTTPEPWLQGTLKDVSAIPRAVLHALELARQDLQHWCGQFTDEELNSRIEGLPSSRSSTSATSRAASTAC